jgi:hypothetical protein
VSVGIGGTFGYNWVDHPTPNQTFEQVNAPPQLRGTQPNWGCMRQQEQSFANSTVNEGRIPHPC